MFGTTRGTGGHWLVGTLLLCLLASGCSDDKDLTNVENSAPIIRGISATLDTLGLGERTELTCHAYDEDNDLLSYTWSGDASEGAFFGADSTVRWVPSEGFQGTATVTAIVSDRKAESKPTSIELTVVGETSTLTGRVIDRFTSLPIESAIVMAAGRSATTDANGIYLFDAIPLGLHTITINHDGYAPFELRNVDVRSDENEVDITLTPTAVVATVTGLVTNSLGNPVEGASCRIGEFVTTTDANGRYTLEGILREAHVLQVSRDDYLFSSQSIVVDDATLTVDVTLDARPPSPPAEVIAMKSGTTITLTWPASPEETVTEYQVYQRIDNETTMEIPGARVDANNRQYTVVGEVDRRYRFRISAFNFEGEQSQVSASTSNLVALTPLTERVEIPGGLAVIGSTPADWIGDDWGTEEHPANPILVETFSLDVHEVSNRQFRAYLYEARSTGAITIVEKGAAAGAYDRETRLLNFNVSKLRLDVTSEHGDFSIVPGFEDHPVVGVTWYGALAYASHFGLRLPTEVEWEKAARGNAATFGTYPGTSVGYGMPSPWGPETPELRLANFGDLTSGTLSVTTLPDGAATQWGDPIYHLAGNAWEWCSDWLGVYQSPHSPPATGDLKVLRGGGFSDSAERLRNGARFSAAPTVGSPSTGFRCAN